jgi:citrate synthase
MSQVTNNEKADFAKGLEGIIAGETALSLVDGKNSKLYYRGISIEEFVGKSSFEEVVYLLWNLRFPTQKELTDFKRDLAQNRIISKALIEWLETLPKTTHPMAVLRTAVSEMGCFDKDADKTDPATLRRIAHDLTAKIPTVLATYHRVREGKTPIVPDASLSHAANFLYMLNGEKPSPEMEKALDTYLILLADHGFNASTFSARVTVATLSDMYSGVTAAIGALKGDLHGSAVQNVMQMFLEIGTPEKAEQYVKDAFEKKKKIMGFGHRIYKDVDPRATAFRGVAEALAQSKGGEKKWVKMAANIEKAVHANKKIPCNVDFFSSYVLYTVGFPVDFFTTIFAASRISGWTAHIIEQLGNNRLIRPEAIYTGPMDQHYLPIHQR